MALKLYNTLTRRLETFRPLKGKTVGLYTCGPTVYNYAHIGNLRTYIFEDVLERSLEWNGYKVKRVMNITDVGHLTSDADAGEDKIEKEAKTEKKTPAQLAAFYTRAFLADIQKLNIRKPPILAPATKHIKEQQALIKELLKKNYAYETPAAVYFDVAKFKKYGRLSGQSLAQKITAARKEVVTDPEKRNPADFALWFKLIGRFRNHVQRWPSPWGDGFPGWHIECSAISRKFLGQPFDIHTGGVDHIGTHHENEIAQSEAAYGKPLAKYWLHGEFLVIGEKRMGKSEGNFITISDVIKRGVNPLAYRYFVLGAHYRRKLNFTWESLFAAENGLKKIYKSAAGLGIERQSEKPINFETHGRAKKYYDNFSSAINSDLNTPRALAALHSTINAKDINPAEKMSLIANFDRVLGLNIGKHRISAKIPLKIKKLAQKREESRKNKQFVQADRLRREIERLGYVVEDTPTGPVLKPK